MSLTADLVERLGMSYNDVARVISSAPARYFVFCIPKRNGGIRIIAQPAREIKAIQRFILDEKLSKFPVHSCATAYTDGSSIRKNAMMHVKSSIILKLDFKKFARKYGNDVIERSDIQNYSKLLFWGETKNSKTPRCLSIGAPTSPALSNILMFSMDTYLFQKSIELNVKYSRYADDITVSGDEERDLLKFEKAARLFLNKQKSPKLHFNEEKRGIYRKAVRRIVTGLIVTPEEKISLGRERKREISAMLHHLSLGKLSPEGKGLLKGWLGFAISVESEFVERLRLKYGNALIDQALKYHIESKRIQLSLRAPLIEQATDEMS